MKKFIIVLLVVLLTVSIFLTGCDRLKPNSDATEEPIPTNGVIVTADPVLETTEAEEILTKIGNK